MGVPRFHLAFPVNDLERAKDFYVGILGCSIGRHSDKWMDFDLYGHQIVAHLAPEDCVTTRKYEVDGDFVPSRHFGVILMWNKWEQLSNIIKQKGISFLIEPRIRFKGRPGEQGTFFISDPSGNALEFKTFRNDDDIFKNFN
tara:strand:+ start:253 stop:678 length:426 start_codon:yes stop_codon:yes gene_type:complete